MATINVSSLEQFCNTISDPNLENDTVIEIMNDLDYNSYEFLATVTMPSNKTGIIINGNGHAIVNLRKFPGSTGSSFFSSANSHVTINNLSFLNCDCLSSRNQSLWYTSTIDSLYLKDGVIQGNFYGYIFSGRCEIENYMITINQGQGNFGGGAANTSPKWRGCWFDIKLWNKKTSGYAFYGLTTCYFQGDLNITNGSQLFRDVVDCCFNIRIRIAIEDLNLNDMFSACTELPSIVNTSKLGGTSSADDTTYLKFVSDEEMHNAEILASKGFNIIP